MMTVSVFAPAKINLSLHITGQTEGGYHLLDSLVAFASYGDTVQVEDGDGLSLMVDGPEAEGLPSGSDNLAFKAAELLASEAGAHLTLTKRLPAASGIGGGSADAAAAFRGMLALGERGEKPVNTIWSMPDSVFETHARSIFALGADVPMCLMSRSVRARGIGEKLRIVNLPRLPVVLVNPRVPVSTADVFRALESKSNAPMPDELPEFDSVEDVATFLKSTRNDLEAPAREIAPEISEVLAALEVTNGCLLSRMSGSGATCFALYSTRVEAGEAASAFRDFAPHWWISDCWLGDQMAAALPTTRRNN